MRYVCVVLMAIPPAGGTGGLPARAGWPISSEMGDIILPEQSSTPRLKTWPTRRGSGGAFGRAIAAATTRVVKLYGLGAGLQAGYGTGVIVSEDGLVLTVFSLLIDARRIRAVTWDGTPFEAHVVRRDLKRQLAMLQLAPVVDDQEGNRSGQQTEPDVVGPLPFFDLAHEAELKPGDWVVAAGNPFKIADGAERVSVAHGVFSTRTRLDARRRLKDFPYRGEVLVIDAITSNPGAPGSTLVNLRGEFVGMIGREVVSNLTHTHFNYAMPRDVLYTFFVEATGGTSERGFPVQPDGETSATTDTPEAPFDPGIRLIRAGYRIVLPFVERVRAGSPAQRAGVRKDDLILSVNGRTVPHVSAYDARIRALEPGEPVDLAIRRGHAILTIRIENVEKSKSQKVETSKHRTISTADRLKSEDRGLSTERPGVPRSAAHNLQSTMDAVRAAQETFRAVGAKMRPYIVRIETVGGSQPRDFIRIPEEEAEPGARKRSQSPFRDTTGSRFPIADGPTTGIVYSPDGYIITSSFNFVREPVLISVTTSDGRRLVADLVARDQVRKIALLKVDAADLPVPEWCETADVRLGQWAIALGLGFAGEEPSITVGIVSALDRMHGNAIQTDAKLNPANYGGPLCDVYGRVIGISVPMAQRPGELAGVELYDCGVGFAVPKHPLTEIVAHLKTGRSFYRGWLGVAIDPRHTDAVVIHNVANPSPMHAAGIKPGDKILGAEGKTIRHFGHLVQSLYMIPAGEQVYLQLESDGREFDIAVTLARSRELGPLPDLEEPFDPSNPLPIPDDE